MAEYGLLAQQEGFRAPPALYANSNSIVNSNVDSSENVRNSYPNASSSTQPAAEPPEELARTLPLRRSPLSDNALPTMNPESELPLSATFFENAQARQVENAALVKTMRSTAFAHIKNGSKEKMLKNHWSTQAHTRSHTLEYFYFYVFVNSISKISNVVPISNFPFVKK